MSGQPRSAPAALILAGGASSRLGTDKTRAPVHGVPLLERVAASAASVAQPVVVVGPWAPAGCRSVLEPNRLEGPLVALVHGLHHVTTDLVLVLAADHPFLAPELLDLLVDTAAALAVEAVVPVSDGRPQPLLACYRTAPARVAGDGAVRAGDRRLLSLLDRLDVYHLDEPEWRQVDRSGRSFSDVDTREDLERATRVAEP